MNNPSGQDVTKEWVFTWVQTLAKHEGEDDEEDEDALSRVHDDAHPHALPPPRGIGGKDDVSQGGGDRPRLVQMVEARKAPRWRRNRPFQRRPASAAAAAP